MRITDSVATLRGGDLADARAVTIESLVDTAQMLRMGESAHTEGGGTFHTLNVAMRRLRLLAALDTPVGHDANEEEDAASLDEEDLSTLRQLAWEERGYARDDASKSEIRRAYAKAVERVIILTADASVTGVA